jgi:hypothetical protein
VAGCDLGKAAAKLVVLSVDGDRVRIEARHSAPHDGRPAEVLAAWYREAGVANCDAHGATGLYADELRAPVVSGLPEDACLTAAIEGLPELRGPLNLVSVGARGYSVLTRDRTGRVQSVGNDKCSSGTGETMVRIAGRFGLSVEKADAPARGASDTIPITARCSVFAKSEMTHFGNQGVRPTRLFAATSARSRATSRPARARGRRPSCVGGCARIRARWWTRSASVRRRRRRAESFSSRGDRRRAAGGRAVSGEPLGGFPKIRRAFRRTRARASVLRPAASEGPRSPLRSARPSRALPTARPASRPRPRLDRQ